MVRNPSPCPPSLIKGRGVRIREGAFAPSPKTLPPLLPKERGIKGVRVGRKEEVMIGVGEEHTAGNWGNFRVKKVAQLKKPVVCYSYVKGKALHEPTLVQIEWEKARSADKHEFWLPYWITWADINGKQRYGQGAPMIGEASLLELLKKAIQEEFFSNKFLHELHEAVTDKLSLK